MKEIHMKMTIVSAAGAADCLSAISGRNAIRGVLALAVLAGFWTATAQSGLTQVKQKHPNPERLKGMKAAIVDIEAGKLKVKSGPPPNTPWHGLYVQLLKKECGVDWEMITDAAERIDEMGGYNDVMRVEIEHRFERDIIAKLFKKAEADYRKSLEPK
jgi:hypothetical protein